MEIPRTPSMSTDFGWLANMAVSLLSRTLPVYRRRPQIARKKSPAGNPAGDFKGKFFMCENIGYSDLTGRVNLLEFEEL